MLNDWNSSGLQETFFANPRSTLESSQIPYQGTHPFVAPNAAGEAPVLISTGKLVASEDERIGSTIPMPQADDCELLCSFGYSTEFSWLGSKDYRYRSFSSEIPYTIIIFYVGR